MDSQGTSKVEGYQDVQSPMENPVVLSNILRYCPVPELRRARLVSKLWLKTSLPIWRKRAVITIKENDELETQERNNFDYYDKNLLLLPPYNLETKKEVTRVSEFLQQFVGTEAELQAVPFQNFRLELQSSRLAQSFVETRFWELCGPNIKYLQIDNYQFADCKLLRDILLGPQTPNLETIVIKYSRDFFEADWKGLSEGEGQVDVYPDKPSVKHVKILVGPARSDDLVNMRVTNYYISRLPVSWEEMLTCFTNLETLDMDCSESRQIMSPTFLEPMQSLLELLRSQGKMKKLHNLSLQAVFDDGGDITVFPFLMSAKLALRSLKLDFGPELQVSKNEYYDLLNSQRETLSLLDIHSLNTSFVIFPLGATFPKLETLVISYQQMDKMEFLSVVPNLKILHILGGVDDDWDHENNSDRGEDEKKVEELVSKTGHAAAPEDCFNMHEIANDDDDGEKTHSNLTELVLEKASHKDMRMMVELFPNVETLSAPLTSHSFQLICKSWTKLRHLTLLEHPAGGVTEPALTGSPPYSASIKDLKNLTYLKWTNHPSNRNEEEKDAYFLTFVSLSQGIFHLPHLRHLEISCRLSEEEKKELFGKIPNCVLYSKVPDGEAEQDQVMYVRETNMWNA